MRALNRARACAKCQRFFKRVERGMIMEEGLPEYKQGTGTVWCSAKLSVADIFECPGCQARVVVPASKPIVERGHPEYDDLRKTFEDQGRLLPMIEG